MALFDPTGLGVAGQRKTALLTGWGAGSRLEMTGGYGGPKETNVDDHEPATESYDADYRFGGATADESLLSTRTAQDCRPPFLGRSPWKERRFDRPELTLGKTAWPSTHPCRPKKYQ